MTTDAELRALLIDCLALWDIQGHVAAGEAGLTIAAGDITCAIRRGPSPTRWFLQTPSRTRPVPSVVALLAAVRVALGATPGQRARIGAGATLT